MRFIIDFVNTTADADITAYFKAQKCTVINVFDAIGKTYLVSCAAEPAASDLIEHIFRDDESPISLLDVAPETVTFESAPQDEHTTADEDNWWKLAVIPHVDMDSEQFKTTRTAKGVRVYVLDSGISVDHADFANRDITLLHSIVENDFSDTTGHGTALASVIVGNQCGITDAALKVVKIFHQGNPVYASDIMSALNAVATDFLTSPIAPAVMNCSWSIAKNDLINQKFADLRNLGLIISVSAGNDGMAISDVTPAAIPEVFTIGSFGTDLKPSNFTNYTGKTDTSLTQGETNHGALDLFAPGESIRVALNTGEYGYTAGTSIAAAITSACFAANLARLTHSYAYYTQAIVEETMTFWATKDILTLDGNFADSPNLVVATRIIPAEDEAKPRTMVNAPRAAPIGYDFSFRTGDPTAYKEIKVENLPSFLTMDQNFITGKPEGPLPESGYQIYEIPVTLTGFDDKTTDSYTLTMILYDPSKFTDLKEATDAAGVVLKFNCVNNCDCCAVGLKMDCDTCTCGPWPPGPPYHSSAPC